jgi:hypothetical protein
MFRASRLEWRTSLALRARILLACERLTSLALRARIWFASLALRARILSWARITCAVEPVK